MVTRYVLSARHGFAAGPAKSIVPIERLPWKEAHLEAALVLNPQLLGVEEHLPLSLGGGSTSNNPDLLFVDEVGRPTVVEIKNETAKIDALAQLLGYGLAWGQLPNGEAEVCIQGYTRTEAAAQVISREIRGLAGLLGLPESTIDASFASAHERLRPLWNWADTNASGLGELAGRLFGPHALSLTVSVARNPSRRARMRLRASGHDPTSTFSRPARCPCPAMESLRSLRPRFRQATRLRSRQPPSLGRFSRPPA
jgi:hypothetical protein